MALAALQDFLVEQAAPDSGKCQSKACTTQIAGDVHSSFSARNTPTIWAPACMPACPAHALPKHTLTHHAHAVPAGALTQPYLYPPFTADACAHRSQT
eukprot:1145033-Pelagomonas_calceolata.AAC.3